METLWNIMFCILILLQIPVNLSWTRKWTIKTRIFHKILNLCICSVLFVLSFYTNQTLILRIGIAICILVLIKALNKELDRFENQVIENCLKAQQQPTRKEIIDAEDFTVLN